MVISENNSFGAKKTPCGYKVAPLNRGHLRTIADGLRGLSEIKGCYKSGEYFIDATHLLEDVLFRAGFIAHPIEDEKLTETAAFTVPEAGLIVMRNSIYEGLFHDDSFSRYTIVHEFSHIVLKHAVTLHRGAVLGEHKWWEDSEWQANNLTAELMMPVETVKKLGCRPILIMTECGVSQQAVQFRLANLRKDGLI